MIGVETVWIPYYARFATGPQHARLIQESVQILETSRSEISLDRLQAERERTGLGHDLMTTSCDVPSGLSQTDLVTYANRHIREQPEFDFFEDVIGDDLVVDGVVYDRRQYTLDGDGVRARTGEELAAAGEDLVGAADPALVEQVARALGAEDPVGGQRRSRKDVAIKGVCGPSSRLQAPGTTGARHGSWGQGGQARGR